VCVTLLTLCNTVVANTEKTFEQLVKETEVLKNKSPNQAYLFLQSYEDIVQEQPLEKQLAFYKVKGEVLIDQGYYHKGKEVAEKGLQMAKQLVSPGKVMIELLYVRGFAVESLGDLEGAKADYINALEIAESIDDQKNVAVGLTNIGAIYYLTEEFERSLTVFNDALRIAKLIKDEELLGFINSEFGILYAYIGEETQSMRFYQKSYEHYKNANNAFYAYNSLRNIAVNHSSNQRYNEAIKIYSEIIENAEAISNVEIIASTYSGLAWAHLNKEDRDEEAAYQYIIIAGQYAAQSQQHEVPLSFLLDKGYILFNIERYDEALEAAHKAELLLNNDKRYLNTVATLNVLYLKAESYLKLNQAEKAYQEMSAYLDYAVSLKDKSNIDAVEDLRMRYESERADLENQLLAQQEKLQSAELNEAKREIDNQNLYMAIIACVSLALAWLLVKLIKGQKSLYKASRTDSLTGVANRRRLFELGERQLKAAQEQGSEFSILLVDVDNFKQINDSFGHKAGDTVLKEIAIIGGDLLRQSDWIGRYGGEEFIVFLPNTSITQAEEIAIRLCNAIRLYSWTDITENAVTVSIGGASNEATDVSFQSLINLADERMYKAKEAGKNGVCC
jgi:diguanylate cyclase